MRTWMPLALFLALPLAATAAERGISLRDFAPNSGGLIRPALGNVYLGFAPNDFPTTDWERRARSFAAQVPFHFYVVVHVDPVAAAAQGLSTSDGVYAWELSVQSPPELVVVARTLAPTGSVDVAGGDDNWVVGTGGTCVPIAQMPYAVLDYQAVLLQTAQDLVVDLDHSEPSSFYSCSGGVCQGRKTAGWLECGAAGDLHPFDAWYEHYASILINPSSGPWPQYEADPAQSSASSAAGTVVICPDGGCETLAQKGLTIQIEVRSRAGTPLAGVPADDLWLTPAAPQGATVCTEQNFADHATDALGHTTFSGEVVGGGCRGEGFMVMLLGIPITGGPKVGPDVVPIATRSPDISGDGKVDLADVGPFARALLAHQGDCSDFDGDGDVDLSDVGFFSARMGHTCGR